MQGAIAAAILSITCVVMLIIVLVFRAFISGSLYIAPDEPYGIADIIELLLGLVQVILLVATAVFALYLAIKGPRHNRIAAIWSGLTVVAIFLLAAPLHTIVARWASA